MTSLYYPPSSPYQGQGDALPPPSYDAALGSAPTARSSRRGLSEKEQHSRGQESASKPSMPSSSTSTLAQLQASPSTSRAVYGGLPLNPQTALAQFGSPFASSSDWAPSAYDARLTHLPHVDLQTRFKMRFSGPSAEKRAAAPPPSFSRPFERTQSHSLRHVEAVYIKSANKREGKNQLLADGFQPVYPGALMVQHDVSAADWGRFLEDLDVAGRLTGMQNLISNVAPMSVHLGTGYLARRAMRRRMKKGKQPAICQSVEIWQQSFFSARNLDVYILRNGFRLTARSPNAPIPPGSRLLASSQLPRSQTSASSRSSSHSSSPSSSSDSDSSADPRNHAFQSTGDRKMDKMQKNALKRQNRYERKQRKAEHKHDKKMARIERKRERDQRKHGVSAGTTGAGVGYVLVIAPLEPTLSEPASDAAAFMW